MTFRPQPEDFSSHGIFSGYRGLVNANKKARRKWLPPVQQLWQEDVGHRGVFRSWRQSHIRELTHFAEHIGDLASDRVFSHQPKLNVRLFFPRRNFRERDRNCAVAEGVLSRLIDIIKIGP